MFITLDHRFAFVHIPKTAGEKVYKIMYDAFRSGLVPDPTTPITKRHTTPPVWHDSAFSAFWGQDNLKGTDATHLHQDIMYDYVGKALYESCVSFAVVRNPYDRFYSAFCDIPSKIRYSQEIGNAEPFWVGAGYPEYGDPRAAGTTPEQRAAMFERFCDIVEQHDIVNRPVTKHNVHLIPQVRFVYRTSAAATPNKRMGTKPNVTTIVHFEKLHTELPEVFRQALARETARERKRKRSPHFTLRRREGGGRGGGKQYQQHQQQHRRRHRPRRSSRKSPTTLTKALPSRRTTTTQTPCERALAGVQREFTAESVQQRGTKTGLYTDRAKKLVSKWYRADFARFGYDV
jgi:hypothetical protein